jgi:hypothetical protein
MTDETMSPLRRRMIEDMAIRKLAPKTQQGYIRIVKDFAAFLGRSPDTASFEDVRRFQLHLAANRQSGRAPSSPLVHPSVLTLASRQTDRRNCSGPASSSPTPRPNPHSARGSTGAQLPRFRALALLGRRPPSTRMASAFRRPRNLHIFGHPRSTEQ